MQCEERLPNMNPNQCILHINNVRNCTNYDPYQDRQLKSEMFHDQQVVREMHLPQMQDDFTESWLPKYNRYVVNNYMLKVGLLMYMLEISLPQQ